MISDRERALLDLFENPTPTCAYHLKGLIPLDGSYGPNTCGFSCVDEPECMTNGPWSIDEFPDLLMAVEMIHAEWQVNYGSLPDDHPLYAWWGEHCNDAE